VVRCEFLRGCSRAFIGARGRAPGDGRSKAAVMAFKAIKARLRSGLKGIKGGVMGGGAVMAQGIPRHGKGGTGAVARWRGAAGSVEKKHMTGEAQVSAAEREKALLTECAKSRRKHISQNTPSACGPSGCEAGGPGGLGGWAGR
jgi:hypothetical protein